MRIVVVGDDVVLREALAELLAVEDALEVVGQAGTAAVHVVTRTRPDLVILDEGTGGQACAVVPAVRDAVPRACVIVLTARADPRRVGPVLLAGADTVLGPGAGKEELFAVVHRWGLALAWDAAPGRAALSLRTARPAPGPVSPD
jgi:two-component system response regulator DesR